MEPKTIAQVDTPGSAIAVACSGDLIAVADGGSGLAVVDVSDPPAARVVNQIDLTGNAQAIVSSGEDAFVGLNSAPWSGSIS